MKLQADLREFIELLNSRGVRYLVVGGFAVAYHGNPRYTGDIDAFVECTIENGKKLEAALHDFGFAETGLQAADFTEPEAEVQLGLPPNRIDIMTGLTGVDFAEAWASRIQDELDGLPVHFISREHLIRNKRATGRTQDVADAEAIDEVQD